MAVSASLACKEEMVPQRMLRRIQQAETGADAQEGSQSRAVIARFYKYRKSDKIELFLAIVSALQKNLSAKQDIQVRLEAVMPISMRRKERR